VGAVSWKPVVLELGELSGRRLDEAAARQAAQAVRALVDPMADVRGSSAYKREMAVEFTARALLLAAKRAQQQ
jgi:CO/xanthine dehydrogenase FAD-binding subunit